MKKHSPPGIFAMSVCIELLAEVITSTFNNYVSMCILLVTVILMLFKAVKLTEIDDDE